MKSFCTVQALDNNAVFNEKIMPKSMKKSASNSRRSKKVLIKKQNYARQTMPKNEGKLHIFSSQLSRLIDAIPDAILLKDKEGRKLVTDQLTKSLFKLHDLDWYSQTDIHPAFALQEIRSDYKKGKTLKSELDLALEKGQLKAHYQIQVDKDRKILGAELLLRWEHPQYGVLVPDQFIPIAEQTGMILFIGAWVLRSACEQLKLWQRDPMTQGVSLAVNISPRQFEQPDFVGQLWRILDKTGIDASLLKLELTESLMLHDIGSAVKKMEALKQRGIRFAMDNFGTGYSSLNQLKTLPINQLKIDQFLMRDIAIDSSDAMIVKTIIDMTKKLGIEVLAGGVEDEQQFDCLKQLGCTGFQGHLFGRPVPVTEFEQQLENAYEDYALAV